MKVLEFISELVEIANTFLCTPKEMVSCDGPTTERSGISGDVCPEAGTDSWYLLDRERFCRVRRAYCACRSHCVRGRILFVTGLSGPRRYRPPRCNKDVLRNLIFSFIKDQNYEETYKRLERCEAMHQLLAFYKHRVNRDDLRDHVSSDWPGTLRVRVVTGRTL